MRSPWQALEQIPGVAAIPKVWRDFMGEDFEIFRTSFFQPWPKPAGSFPCPIQTHCFYWLIEQHDGSITGTCQQNPSGCKPISPIRAEVTPLQLSWTKLGRALCKALNCDSKPTPLGLLGTLQIGTWSADAVPVILSIQFESDAFRHLIAEVAVRLGRPFILLAPTNLHWTVHCDELIAHARAAFFSLENIVTLTRNGSLHPIKTPGDLFAKFTPEPKEPVAENTAFQLFALAKFLDTENVRKAPPSTVLRLYCVEGLEPKQIARKLKCARSLIYSRLRLLSRKLGREPAELRQYSSHLSQIEDSLSDTRARRIQRKGAIGEGDSPE